MKRIIRTAVTTLSVCGLLSGCAHPPSNPKVDPYENMNRVFFAFNQDMDHLVLRPASKAYRAVTPSTLRQGVTNVFSNLGETTTFANDVLQGKLKFAVADFWRFFINSTIGIGGLFDVASHVGIKKRSNNFGLTLAYWTKYPQSAYLQLPFFGPTTVREGLGKAIDISTSLSTYAKPADITLEARALLTINARVKLLDADPLIDQAFDPYILVRNGYLQRRQQQLKAFLNISPTPTHPASEHDTMQITKLNHATTRLAHKTPQHRQKKHA